MLNGMLWSGSLVLLLIILNLAQTTGRQDGSIFRRTWSGSFAEGLAKGVEEAILEVQAIEQPEKRYARNEHKATRIVADDSGGPDDPRLLHGELPGRGPSRPAFGAQVGRMQRPRQDR